MPPKFLEQCFPSAGYYTIIMLKITKLKILCQEAAVSVANVTQVLFLLNPLFLRLSSNKTKGENELTGIIKHSFSISVLEFK